MNHLSNLIISGARRLLSNLRVTFYSKVLLSVMTIIPSLIVGANAQTHQINDVEILSLTNYPKIIQPSLVIYKNILAVKFEASFANDCLLQAGAEAFYVDFPSHESQAQKDTRILLLKQNSTRNGCPEIYQPVRRNYLVLLENTENINHLAFFDQVFSSSDIWKGVSVSLEVKDVFQKIDSEQFDIIKKAIPLARNEELLQLVKVSVVQPSATTYRINFSVPISIPAKSLRASLYDSRDGLDKGGKVSRVHWFMVFTSIDEIVESDNEENLASYSISVEFPRGVSLSLVLANPSDLITESCYLQLPSILLPIE